MSKYHTTGNFRLNQDKQIYELIDTVSWNCLMYSSRFRNSNDLTEGLWSPNPCLQLCDLLCVPLSLPYMKCLVKRKSNYRFKGAGGWFPLKLKDWSYFGRDPLLLLVEPVSMIDDSFQNQLAKNESSFHDKTGFSEKE